MARPPDTQDEEVFTDTDVDVTVDDPATISVNTLTPAMAEKAGMREEAPTMSALTPAMAEKAEAAGEEAPTMNALSPAMAEKAEAAGEEAPTVKARLEHLEPLQEPDTERERERDRNRDRNRDPGINYSLISPRTPARLDPLSQSDSEAAAADMSLLSKITPRLEPIGIVRAERAIANGPDAAEIRALIEAAGVDDASAETNTRTLKRPLLELPDSDGKAAAEDVEDDPDDYTLRVGSDIDDPPTLDPRSAEQQIALAPPQRTAPSRTMASPLTRNEPPAIRRTASSGRMAASVPLATTPTTKKNEGPQRTASSPRTVASPGAQVPPPPTMTSAGTPSRRQSQEDDETIPKQDLAPHVAALYGGLSPQEAAQHVFANLEDLPPVRPPLDSEAAGHWPPWHSQSEEARAAVTSMPLPVATQTETLPRTVVQEAIASVRPDVRAQIEHAATMLNLSNMPSFPSVPDGYGPGLGGGPHVVPTPPILSPLQPNLQLQAQQHHQQHSHAPLIQHGLHQLHQQPVPPAHPPLESSNSDVSSAPGATDIRSGRDPRPPISPFGAFMIAFLLFGFIFGSAAAIRHYGWPAFLSRTTTPTPTPSTVPSIGASTDPNAAAPSSSSARPKASTSSSVRPAPTPTPTTRPRSSNPRH